MSLIFTNFSSSSVFLYIQCQLKLQHNVKLVYIFDFFFLVTSLISIDDISKAFVFSGGHKLVEGGKEFFTQKFHTQFHCTNFFLRVYTMSYFTHKQTNKLLDLIGFKIIDMLIRLYYKWVGAMEGEGRGTDAGIAAMAGAKAAAPPPPPKG